MRAGEFDEVAFFRAIHRSGARALLIGRRALVLLGLPVLTADYDFWIASDDIERFNAGAAEVGLTPSHDAESARRRGRYVLEDDEHVDVMVARAVSTVGGVTVSFDDVWLRRQAIALATDVDVLLPSIDDLVLTKQFASRPVANIIDRRLTLDELCAYVDRPVTPEERQGVLDLVRWFTTRYRTPLERLAYVRRASARWSRAAGRGAASEMEHP